jgi:sugar O-acyltransferase (sialic acid O-acetyltransferase NeuD family)
MTRPGVILIGAGGHARACIDVIEQHDCFKIVGLVGKFEQMHTKILGYDVIGVDTDLPELAKYTQYAIISVGQIQTAEKREQLYVKALKSGFQFPVIISPTAYVSKHSQVGSGTIVMHGAMVNSGVMVGSNCIINSNSLIEHDVMIEDHCHISTGAILNGAVTIGPRSFIGSRSVIREGIAIGNNSVVGMGVSVRHNLPENSCFKG